MPWDKAGYVVVQIRPETRAKLKRLAAERQQPMYEVLEMLVGQAVEHRLWEGQEEAVRYEHQNHDAGMGALKAQR